MRPTLSLHKKLSASSNKWLSRQFRDPYVKERLSNATAYRSRAAFKLLELDAEYRFLAHPDVRVVIDLGAAPGGWSQVVAAKVNMWQGNNEMEGYLERQRQRGVKGGTSFGLKESKKLQSEGTWSLWDDMDMNVPPSSIKDVPSKTYPSPNKTAQPDDTFIIALDLLRIAPIPGVRRLQMDFLEPGTKQTLAQMLSAGTHGPCADVILSDMAANMSGNGIADSQANLDICRAVLHFASMYLRSSESVGRRRAGVLVLKHFDHPWLDKFRKTQLERAFEHVYNAKPPSSRSESSEAYWVCMGWRGQEGRTHLSEPLPDIEL